MASLALRVRAFSRGRGGRLGARISRFRERRVVLVMDG